MCYKHSQLAKRHSVCIEASSEEHHCCQQYFDLRLMLDGHHSYWKHRLMKFVEMPYFVQHHSHVGDQFVAAAVVVEEVIELVANED